MSYTIKAEGGQVEYPDGDLATALIAVKNFIENDKPFQLVEDSYLPEFVDVTLIETYSPNKFLYIAENGQLETINRDETLNRIEEVIKRG